MRKIDDLEKMDCAEIVTALKEIISEATVEATKLSAEIEKAYSEKDTAEAEMHQAAEKKDLRSYKDARAHFDMLTEFIAKSEDKQSTLTDGRIIDAENAAEIRRRMIDQGDKLTGEAALKIDALFREMQGVLNELNQETAKLNRVLIALNECTRPKDANGERESPEIIRDVVIAPYLREISMMQSMNKAAFRVYVDRHKRQ